MLLAGATGLVGAAIIHAVREHPSFRLVALTRREVPIPRGTRMEMLVADPSGWPDAVAAIAPDAVICALGTTRREAGSEAAFRAVDHDLVLELAVAGVRFRQPDISDRDLLHEVARRRFGGEIADAAYPRSDA